MRIERTIMGTSNKTPPPGQVLFTSSSSWSVPANVTSICAVAVGGGGGGADGLTADGYLTFGAGGGGGALAYANSITVYPGETLTIIVGVGGPPRANQSGDPGQGGYSALLRGATTLVRANGGGCATGTYLIGDTRIASQPGSGGAVSVGTGGSGGLGGAAGSAGGGGGAGGYSGNGGTGYFYSEASRYYAQAGSGGGGGGGGGGAYFAPPYNLYVGAAGGGGVDVLGQGTNGEAGYSVFNVGSYGGGGGSGGTYGGDTASLEATDAGLYGGGGAGGGGYRGYGTPGSAGGQGVVRIIWGEGRAFPSTNTDDV